MAYLGKQYRHCPNCGEKLYDDKLCMDHVKSMMCSKQCIDEWELKYARMILKKNA